MHKKKKSLYILYSRTTTVVANEEKINLKIKFRLKTVIFFNNFFVFFDAFTDNFFLTLNARETHFIIRTKDVSASRFRTRQVTNRLILK